MQTKTIIEKGCNSDDDMLVMFGDGTVHYSDCISAAKRLIRKHDKSMSREHGTIVNVLEWRGFTEKERNVIAKKS